MQKVVLGLCCTCFALGACVSMPDFGDMPQLPDEFVSAGEADYSYGSAVDIPETVTDMRSAAQWDKDASRLQDKTLAFSEVDKAIALDPATLPERAARLRAQVNAYKLDDPQ